MTKKTDGRRLTRVLAFLLIAFFFVAKPLSVQADEFASPTFANIIKILVRLGALDLSDDLTLNSYAMVEECKLYDKFFSNDFKWHDVQIALRKSISQDVGTFPTGLAYNAILQLGHYDFKEKQYLFTEKTSLDGVNFFFLTARSDTSCGKITNNNFPFEFRLVLDQPVVITGLPLSEEDGKTLLQRMVQNNNKDHFIYVRFNMRVVYVSRLARPKSVKGTPPARLLQDGKRTVRLDAHLGSIDFFEDEARTKLIYSYRP